MESVVLPVAGAILSILAGKMSWYMKGYIPPGLFSFLRWQICLMRMNCNVRTGFYLYSILLII